MTERPPYLRVVDEEKPPPPLLVTFGLILEKFERAQYLLDEVGEQLYAFGSLLQGDDDGCA